MAKLSDIPIETLRRRANKYERFLLAPKGTFLLKVPFSNCYIQLLWREHYVGSKGTVGRQLHYIVYFDGQAVGGISGGSAIFRHKKRDEFLNLGDQDRQAGLPHIINNTMFRMTRAKDQPPKATEVLKLFREQATGDWLSLYGDAVFFFETLVQPPRWGGIYKLDGWTRIGKTAGLGARRPIGHGTRGKSSTGRRKIIRTQPKILWVRSAND